MSEEPTLTLHFEEIVCPIHAEPFRKHWPNHAPDFTGSLLQTMVDERMPQYKEKGMTVEQMKEKWPTLDDFVRDHLPACCNVDPLTLGAEYVKSGITHQARCEKCRARQVECVPFTCHEPEIGPELQTYKHLCLSCLIERMRPHPLENEWSNHTWRPSK